MSTASYALADSATMVRRNIMRLVRYPSLTVLLIGMPVVFLLLFVYVFGVQTVLALAAVIGVALLVGFRPSAGPVGWLALVGVLVLMAVAFIWLAVALGLASRTVESSSNVGLPLVLLPFLSSGFVPTDSMPAVLRWFAEYQPFTPLIETIRALLTGTPPGSSLIITIGWCVVIAGGGYLWSKKLFNRESTR